MFWVKRDFLAPILDIALIFCVQIPLLYEHLFYKYFDRRSVSQAANGKRASLRMDVVILVLIMKINIYDPLMVFASEKKTYISFKYFALKLSQKEEIGPLTINYHLK